MENLTTVTPLVNQVVVRQTVPPVWSAMVRAEPRLATLAAELQSARPERKGFWPRWEGYRFRILQLAGWDSHNSALGTSEHYEEAVRNLYKAYSRK